MLESIALEYPDDLAVIAYHAWWPNSGDPYYQYNISENSGRINYYVADYTPHLWIDGNVDGQWLTNTWESKIVSDMAVESPIAINLVVDHDEVTGTGTIDAVISATEPITYTNLYVRFAITESDLPPIHYYTQPIEYALRDMVTNITGQSLTIAQGDVVTKSTSYTLNPTFDFENLEIVAFVQSDNGKRVLQAAKFTLPGPHVTVYPTGEITVPKGGTLYFDSVVQNYRDNSVNGDFWLSAVLPNGNEVTIPESYLNLPNPLSGEITGWDSISFSHELSIPTSHVPIGTYSLVGNIGQFPNVVIERTSFDFTITN